MNINEHIFELFDYIDENSDSENNALIGHLEYVDKAWNALPEPKLDDPDRTLLALPMMDLSLKVKKFEIAKKWIEIYLYEETDQGAIALYYGKLEFEKGNYNEAHDLFSKAFKLSNGRMMEGEGEYLELYLNPEKYMDN